MMKRVALVLLSACAACATDVRVESGERPANDTTRLTVVPLSGDAVIAEAARVLGNERLHGLRFAFDRGVNEVGAFGVEAYPTNDCNGKPEDVMWNGEDQALMRLGIIGLADVIALEAVSNGNAAETHVEWLAGADGNDQDAERALQILAAVDSPTLILSAVQALANNAALSEPAYRTLTSFAVELYEQKRFRAADGSLRLPDFTHPPTEAALLARLLASPATSYRIAAVRLVQRSGAIITPATADSLLDDAHFELRTAAARILWKGSDTTPARQTALLGWFSSTEGRRQIRAAVLRDRYDLSEEQAVGWAAEPAGFGELMLETVASFVGDALETAPVNADIDVLVQAATGIHEVTTITEIAARAAARSTRYSDAQKKAILLALLPAAESSLWNDDPTAFNHIWRSLAGRLLVSANEPEIIAAFEKGIYIQDAAVKAQLVLDLKSPSQATRRAALKTLAKSQPPFAAAVIDAGIDVDEVLGTGDGFVLGAALDNKADPQKVIDRVLSLAQVPAGETELTLRFWGDADVTYLEAFARAVEAMPAAARLSAITRFGELISAWNVVAQYAPGPSAPGFSREVRRILRALEAMPESQQIGAWQKMLVRQDGTLRSHLLPFTPTTHALRDAVAKLVAPRLIVKASTCWQGHADPSTERDAIWFGVAPYVVSPPTVGVDLSKVLSGRVASLRVDSASAADLGGAPKLADVLAAKPKTKDRYLGAPPWGSVERDRWTAAAATLATQILTATGGIEELVQALAFTVDYGALPESTLAAIDTAMVAKITEPVELERWRFYLRAMRGDGYDSLAVRFRGKVALRWDLADAVRSQGEKAAMERLLASVGNELGTPLESLNLASVIVGRADVGEAFRIGLMELGAEGIAFWGPWGQWSTGTAPLMRASLPSLDFVLRAAALHAHTIVPQNEWQQQQLSLFGLIACDARLSAKAATQLAWTTLSNGVFDGPFVDIVKPEISVTSAVDMVLCIGGRSDVPEVEKRDLVRALMTVLP